MREPVSGHEVVKKKRDCNNLEKETASLEKVKVIARIHTDFPTKFGIPRQSGLSDATGLVVFESEFRQPDALRGIEEYTHLWLLWGFSEVRQESGTWKATVRYFRDLEEMNESEYSPVVLLTARIQSDCLV
ncbi:MAG: TrmO family methyltransferase [Dorea formicigenerans]